VPRAVVAFRQGWTLGLLLAVAEIRFWCKRWSLWKCLTNKFPLFVGESTNFGNPVPEQAEERQKAVAESLWRGYCSKTQRRFLVSHCQRTLQPLLLKQSC